MDKLIKKLKDIVNEKFNSTCPNCGIKFNCGVKSGNGDCWCFYETNVKTIRNVDHTDCYCKKCLKNN